MESPDGEGLSQLYLEPADAYKKRFMLQNGEVAVLKCSPIWKKMRKIFKTLSELKARSFPKRNFEMGEAMAVSARKGTILSLWKKGSNKDVSWVCAYLFLFQLKKREINDKGGICVSCDVT